MESKLHEVTFRHRKKSYTYLFITVPKKVMNCIGPAKIVITDPVLITLNIKKRKDGRGYAILPTDLVRYYNFSKGQEIKITLVFSSVQKSSLNT